MKRKFQAPVLASKNGPAVPVIPAVSKPFKVPAVVLRKPAPVAAQVLAAKEGNSDNAAAAPSVEPVRSPTANVAASGRDEAGPEAEPAQQEGGVSAQPPKTTERAAVKGPSRAAGKADAAPAAKLPKLVGGLRRPPKPAAAMEAPAAAPTVASSNQESTRGGRAEGAEGGGKGVGAPEPVSVPAAVPGPPPGLTVPDGGSVEQAPRRVQRLPSILSSTMPRLEDLGVNTSLPTAKAMMGALPVPSLGGQAVVALDHHQFGKLGEVVLALEEEMLPDSVEAGPLCTPPSKSHMQVLLTGLGCSKAQDGAGSRLAAELMPSLAEGPVKVQFQAARSNNVAGAPLEACGATQRAQGPPQAVADNSAQTAGSSAPDSPPSAVNAPAATLPPIYMALHRKQPGAAPGLGLSGSTGAAGWQSGAGEHKQPAAELSTGPSKVKAPVAAAAEAAAVPTPPVWDERFTAQLIGEQHAIPLSFLKRLVFS